MPSCTDALNGSGLRDNHTRGSVADFLREKVRPGSRLSVVSAYFSAYANHALVDALPRTSVGRAIGGQLIRSGTSVGANYLAACRGRSKTEFTAKMGTVAEEADESCFWLELIVEGGLLAENSVKPSLTEANELIAIFTTAAKTSRLANQQSKIANENP